MEEKKYKEPIAPKRVMTIHAHPDDQEVSVGGTIAKWAKAGSEIICVVVTNGEAGAGDEGNRDPSKNDAFKPHLIKMREGEQFAANKLLGVRETIFMGYPDGELQPTMELRKKLTRLIRKYKPDVVVCGDPTVRFFGSNYMNHPDHRVVADVAIDAIFPSAGTRLIFTDLLKEGLEPHDVKKVFMHGTDKPDTWVDITDTIDLKIQALKLHTSQQLTDEVDKWLRGWGEEDGKAAGVKYAEAYRVMVLKEDEETKVQEG